MFKRHFLKFTKITQYVNFRKCFYITKLKAVNTDILQY